MMNRYSKGIPVVAYSPEWVEQYEAIADELAAALNGIAIDAIEHVGSTSVPGLPAKPILDIDVIVQREAMLTAKASLERAGYVHCGDLGRD